MARTLGFGWLVLCMACGSNGESVPADAATDEAVDGTLDAVDADPGSCSYAGPVASVADCREYDGAGWTAAAAQADCAGLGGTWTASACSFEDLLGTCRFDAADPAYRVLLTGTDPGRCNATRTACAVVAGGAFEPGPLCDGLGAPDAGWGSVPFVQAYQLCVDARAGEPAGQTDGHVCTWTLISGCTEDGRRYDDYASCGDVVTQRPYSPGVAETTGQDDPRLQDTAYMAEVAWAAKQVEACGCACCHTQRLAPNGPAGWYVDAPGIWLDGVRDTGLALFLNKADSRALGAFPPDRNNGFNRSDIGLPTTDVPRLRKLFQDEWDRRKLTDGFAATVPPFGGPLVEMFTFVPTECAPGEGVLADGSVYWGEIPARYLYVLRADAKGPVVPPNLDLPDGTIWLVDVPNVAPTFTEAVYGQVTGDQRQVVPATGAPPALESGKAYYLYVLIDVGFPAVRCLFTAP